MASGRNDPCPCGSGRKYKHCCAAKDSTASPLARALGGGSLSALVESARAHVKPGASWEADVVPLPAVVDDPAARPVGTLVAADGFVVHLSLESHPSSELSDVADLIARGVQAAAADLARRPNELLVRDPVIASMVAKLLADESIVVRSERMLPTLHALSAELVSQLSGHAGPMPLMSIPHTWGAWRVPDDVIRGVFSAAAAFHRAHPWSWLDNERLLDLQLASGRRWVASVLGTGGAQFGLALFQDPRDFNCLLAGHPAGAFAAMQFPMLSLTFDRRDDLPRPMVREISRAGWEVVSPAAYPSLMALNTPGGVVTRDLFADMTESLRAVTRFVSANERVLAESGRAGDAIDWTDPAAGSLVSYPAASDDAGVPWAQVGELAPGLPEGPSADPESALVTADDFEHLTTAGEAILVRFSDSLVDAPAARARRDVENAGYFLELVIAYSAVSLTAVTEFDLRSFLYDWFPRKVRTSRSHAMTVRASLRRFFEFLDAHEGISYPWAHRILADKDSYEHRWDNFPGGFFWDPAVRAWMQELTMDFYARALLPDSEIAGVGEWGDTMGADEARLYRELRRRWLIWRDEVIRAGTTDPATVRGLLARRQHEWEERPGAGAGSSPSKVIARERSARPVELR